MPRSMTGFGVAQSADEVHRCSVEIRSVNGRYLKTHCRLPDELYGLESDIETCVSRRLERGTVTVVVRYVDDSSAAAGRINVAALNKYVEQLRPLTDQKSCVMDLAQLTQLPGVLSEDRGDQDLDGLRGLIMPLIDQALDGVESMRRQEGAVLVDEIKIHLDRIDDGIIRIEAAAKEVVEAYQARLRHRMESLLAEVHAEVRPEDLLREVAVFAERSDVTEELARLRSHLQHFRSLLSQEDELVGRTLDFIAQEMLREANTIGSKCLDSSVGKDIVEIKGAVDRVKEQIQNLE